MTTPAPAVLYAAAATYYAETDQRDEGAPWHKLSRIQQEGYISRVRGPVTAALEVHIPQEYDRERARIAAASVDARIESARSAAHHQRGWPAMSPLVRDPHSCALPMERPNKDPRSSWRAMYQVGVIWECRECGQRWKVIATNAPPQDLGAPTRVWEMTQDQLRIDIAPDLDEEPNRP